MNTNYPKCRTDEIVVQELNGEILIYDLRDNRAMALNETSAAVWRACDGSNSVADIAKTVGNEDIAWLALDELRKNKLIESALPEPSQFDGMSRREVIRKVGMGSLLAIPVIASVVAPVAAQAGSCRAAGSPGCPSSGGGRPSGCACNGNGNCTSGSCVNGCCA